MNYIEHPTVICALQLTSNLEEIEQVIHLKILTFQV